MNVDFAQTPPAQEPARPARRRLLLLSSLIIILLFVVTTLVGIGRFASAAFALRDHLQQTEAALTTLSFQEAKVSVDEALVAAQQARSGLRWLFWVQAIPYLGDHVEATHLLLESGIASGEAFSEVLTIAMEVQGDLVQAQELAALTELDGSYTFETLPEDLKVELLSTLHRQSDLFYAVAVKLRLADRELKKLDALSLSPSFTEAIAPMRKAVPEFADMFSLLAPIAQSLDAFAGLNQDRQWLLLFLNNTEMRPGGGFIGVFGLLEMSKGEMKQLSVADSYAIDQLVEATDYHVTPPTPIRSHLGLDTWYFRDANWSPDFAQSSRDTITLLRQEFGYIGQPVPQIDGVIGFTPTVAERLLEVIGPLTVDGMTFTSENITETLEYEVGYGFAQRGIAREDRKVIVSHLMDAVLDRVFAMPFDELPALFLVVATSVEDKQIAFYSADEQTQSVFEDSGWAAGVSNNRVDDVLLVVDANMGALKTNHAVEQKITYSIVPEDEGYVASVSILYDHRGTFDFRTSQYMGYTRVYAPLGSEILSVEGSTMTQADVQDELGMTSFGAHVRVQPGNQGTLSFTYRLPESVKEAIDSGLYQLGLIKQVGSKQHALTLDLDFGKTVRTATPSESQEEYGDSFYRLNTKIDQDQVVTVGF